MRWICLAALTLAGCSEYEMNNPGPALDGDGAAIRPKPGDDGSGGDGTGGSGTGWHDPDTFTNGDCEDGIPATWLSPEIALFASDSSAAVAQIEVSQAGVYDVYDLLIAESGDRQWNESAYIRIPSSASPDGTPLFGNCDGEWIVRDPDNWGPQPPGTAMYLGTFHLDAGINDVELYHYCQMYLDGYCQQWHYTDDPESTCETTNPNSVHLTGAGICLRPV